MGARQPEGGTHTLRQSSLEDRWRKRRLQRKLRKTWLYCFWSYKPVIYLNYWYFLNDRKGPFGAAACGKNRRAALINYGFCAFA
jgi:hypothetical protein